MSELINTNVFAEDKKFVDVAGLQYFWEKSKGYVDAADNALEDRVAVNEGDIKSIQDELTTISGGVGSVGTQIDNAIAALDLPNTYEAKGEAAKAEAAAKAYADGKDSAMDARVKVLEEIDHDAIAADAAAAAVAGVIDGAPESFDTLKEVAAWIADNDHATDVATLVTDVANLKAIDHNAYVAADEANLANAKDYVDNKVDGQFDTKGSANQALEDAKDYADGLAGNYEVAGAAATAQAAAIAQAKLDAADALKAYYTKTEVDDLLSTNSTGDRAYAKQYTDELFNSFQFAQNSDIDALFA